jgi:hypothetical protein
MLDILEAMAFCLPKSCQEKPKRGLDCFSSLFSDFSIISTDCCLAGWH